MMTATTCDFCSDIFDPKDRHVVAQPRPSDPQSLVATMWSCEPCGIEMGLPTPAEINEGYERGELGDILFLEI